MGTPASILRIGHRESKGETPDVAQGLSYARLPVQESLASVTCGDP